MYLPSEAYMRDRWAFTHGRCKSCGIIFAWPTNASKRLRDGPRCPECGRELTRTCAGLVKDGTLKARIQVRDPNWNVPKGGK